MEAEEDIRYSLRQGLSLNLPLGWWPVSLIKSLVSGSHSTRDRGVLPHLAFTLVLGI